MFSDGHGRRMSPYRIANQIAHQSSVPIFSYWDSLMESGVVGGYVLSFEKIGHHVGNAMLTATNGGFPVKFSPMRYVYDWNALDIIGNRNLNNVLTVYSITLYRTILDKAVNNHVN